MPDDDAMPTAAFNFGGVQQAGLAGALGQNAAGRASWAILGHQPGWHH